MGALCFDQLAAQLHQRRGAAGRHVHAAEDFLARRLGHALQPGEVRCARIGVIRGRGGEDRVAIGREITRQDVEDALAPGLVESPVESHGAPRQDRAGRLPSLGDQRAQQASEPLGTARGARGGERAQEAVEELAWRVHGAAPGMIPIFNSSSATPAAW
jgi:hypothetical protein